MTVTDHIKEGAAPIRSDAGSVYPLREDTHLLLRFARVSPKTSLLEIGCGGGEASVIAARGGAFVVATDFNPVALRSLAARARSEALDIRLVRTDLARGLRRFDRILANPPYLPIPPGGQDLDRWHNLAVDGGPDGCEITARLLETFPRHLNPGGAAFLLVSSLQSPQRMEGLLSQWQAVGGYRRIAASRSLEGERLEVWELGF